jgi:hypothetical protein
MLKGLFRAVYKNFQDINKCSYSSAQTQVSRSSDLMVFVKFVHI